MAENYEKLRQGRDQERLRELGQEALLGNKRMHIEDIDYESTTSGEVYRGSVTFRRANAGDLMRMAGIKSMYVQRQFTDESGNPMIVDPVLIDPMLTSIAEVIANLKVVIVNVTEGLEVLMEPEKCDDVDFLFYVYGRYQAWRASFRKGDSTESDQADRGTDA